MATPSQFSENAALLAFVLEEGPEWNPEVLEALAETFGPVRHRGKLFPFDKTDYYTPEMGKGLYRGVVSFEKTVAPQNIGREKEISNALESRLSAEPGKRRVNIDIGYMDLDKVVLPSYKRGPFKLYAGDGLWLDMILHYAKGHFVPTAWAFDDFKRNPYEHDLLLVREKFKKGTSKNCFGKKNLNETKRWQE
jgi:hypothetical protein